MANAYVKSRTAKTTAGFYPYFPVDNNYGYTEMQRDTQSMSEFLYRSTLPGKTIIGALAHYVIGKGLVPMASPEISLLDWTPEQVKTFQKQAEAYWRLVTGKTAFDFYGNDNFKALQREAFKTILITGDVLLHTGYRRTSNGKVLPFVQVISGKMLANDGYNNDTMKNVGGVILDANGKHIGYQLKVIDNNRGEDYGRKTVSKFNTAGRMEFSLISLDRDDPTLVRGIPLLTHMRDEILNLDRYKENHLTRSAIQAIFTAFIEKDVQAPDATESFKDKLMSAYSEAPTEDERVVKLGAGSVIELENGEKANIVESQANAEDYGAYVKAVMGDLASSIGASYETVMGAFNASFSASRAGLNCAEKNFSILREEFADKFCKPVWEMVLTHGILSGYIDAPRFGESEIINDAIFASTWTGVTPPQVDPVKEVSAYKEAIEAGLCTRDYACRNLYGMDAEEVFERLKEEEETLAEFRPMGATNASNVGNASDNNNNGEEA